MRYSAKFYFENAPITCSSNVPYNIASFLPSSIINELGLENEPTSQTNSLSSQYLVPREQSIKETSTFHNDLQDSPNEITVSNLHYFLVQLPGEIVSACSLYNKISDKSDKIIVQDGLYFRIGKILKNISLEEIPSFSRNLHAVSLEVGNEIYQYSLDTISKVSTFIKSFFLFHNLSSQIANIELVSYRSRALLKILLKSFPDDQIIPLSSFLLSLFGIAVQIFISK